MAIQFKIQLIKLDLAIGDECHRQCEVFMTRAGSAGNVFPLNVGNMSLDDGKYFSLKFNDIPSYDFEWKDAGKFE